MAPRWGKLAERRKRRLEEHNIAPGRAAPEGLLFDVDKMLAH